MLGAALCSGSSALAHAATRPPPAAIALTTGWQFRADPQDAGLAADWQRGGSQRGWSAVSVPHVFDARPLPQLFDGTVGWYRLRFRTPAATAAGFGWAVHFDQARRVAAAWFNGHPIGSSTDPYAPFQLDLPALRPGAVNLLTVRVDNRKGAEPREGWWNWGGLTRPVSLVPLGPLVLTNVGLLPQLSCTAPSRCHGSLMLDADITNRTAKALPATFHLTLTPPGHGARPQADTIAGPQTQPGATTHVRLTIPLTQPLRLWSPGHGALYGAQLQTYAGKTLAEQDNSLIGMREAQVRDGVLYVNDRAVQLHGASVEEDLPGRGPALSGADANGIVAELRALHANITRSQYPLSPVLLEKLDRAGIMVWSQAPIYHRDELLRTPGERETALETLAASVIATRQHPSVIAESIANELTPTPDTNPTTRDYIDTAVPIVRELDPGTPVAIDVLSYPGYPPQRTYEQFDLLGINDYFGWYTGPKGPHSTASLAELEPFLAAAHAAYPHQALVVSEFGAEADVNGPATEKQTYAFQTAYLERTLATVAALPYMNGAIYWTLREFAVKPYWDGGAHRTDVPRDSLHHKGLISYAGVPKPAFYAAAAIYARTPNYRVPPVLAPPPVPGPRTPASPAPLVLALLGLLALAAISLRRMRRPLPGVDAAAADQPW